MYVVYFLVYVIWWSENQGNNHIVKTENRQKFQENVALKSILIVCHWNFVTLKAVIIVVLQLQQWNTIFKKPYTLYGGEHSMNTRKSWKSNINNHISSKRVSACQRNHFNRANAHIHILCAVGEQNNKIVINCTLWSFMYWYTT